MIFSKTDTCGPGTIGPKALRLLELTHAGFNIPPFVVISGEEILAITASGLDHATTALVPLVQDICTILPVSTYAVRSAVATEDTNHSAQAGQFTTILNVPPEHLSESIVSVIRQAETKLPRGLIDCSIIVQHYIEPTYAGVIFTRNPLVGRELVVEFRAGAGEQVVGGEAVTQLSFLGSNTRRHEQSLPQVAHLATLATKIETMYNHPQDIEWAIQGNAVYLLQTRPITSITSSQWRGIQLIERATASDQKFYYEKTASCETFATPRPLAFSILTTLHERAGPIELAYRRIGARYTADPLVFRQFGNDVFVNREREIRTLFPAFGYPTSRLGNPGLISFRGLTTTLKNLWSLARLSTSQHQHHYTLLKQISDELPPTPASVTASLLSLSKHYQTIFAITITAHKAFTKLEKLLGQDAHLAAGLLSQNAADLYSPLTFPDAHALRGNSLNIDDTSPFVSAATDSRNQVPDPAVDTWWNSIPYLKQMGLLPHLTNARHYQELRELARVLSVQLINTVRTAVEHEGAQLFPDSPDLIYFATITEICTGTVSRDTCEGRRLDYTHFQNIHTPPYIASFIKPAPSPKHVRGVSSGVADGTVVTKEMLTTTEGRKILYTEILSPDLVTHFGTITGIIATHGGTLSHLAIMARESGIPVVVTNGYQIIPIGIFATINGLTGEIQFDQ